jgi:argininosuccinate lyase
MRTAHEAVGGLVKECESRGCRLVDLPRERFEAVLPGKGGAVAGVLGVPNAVNAFQSYGSTAPAQVEQQLAEWKKRVA